eukprot:TRINITY_DN33226_c0_g1_i1.p1 TRINITY_DN33226_c0_g1~~TRINITY_DN33226_c0_g1_i1.p1  ORF type:complete len:623 (-),score=104.98 TRINITY_DN33226_c0_g1_i1:36-1904(-)
MSVQMPTSERLGDECDEDLPAATSTGQSSSTSTFTDFFDSPDKRKSWKEWAGREEDGEQYKFGDFSRGMLNAMASGVRDLQHKVADTAIAIREGHEQRAVEYVRELAKEDEQVKDIAKSTISDMGSIGTASERFWCGICKDAHTDHKPEYDATASPGSCGTLEVNLLNIGSQQQVCRQDGSEATKPVVMLCLGNHRSCGVRISDATKEKQVVSSASFQVYEVAGSDLGVYVFDRGSKSFQMGSEDKAFCGGCLVPLAAILQHSAGDSLGSGLRSSCSSLQFHTRMTFNLLPLGIVRSKSKLEPASLTGATEPKVQHGTVQFDLKLVLKEVPMKLYFQPVNTNQAVNQTLAEYKGHVGDPFSVLKAFGMAVGRVGSALQIDSWKVAADELRESTVLAFGWSFLVLVAPLWLWPLLLTLVLPLFAMKINRLSHNQNQFETIPDTSDSNPSDFKRESSEGHRQTNRQPRLYVDPDEERSKDPFMKEVVKVELNIMQLTESINKAAAQLEKIKFALTLEDRCRSFICLCVLLAASIGLSLGLFLLMRFLEFVSWRYLLWLPSTCVLLPKALRQSVFDAVAKAQEFQNKFTGDDMERALAGLWHRIPDSVEALHLSLFKEYVLAKHD